MYLRDRVIILKSEPFREHDRRLVMFGVSYGRLDAVARGVGKMESKQAGHLLPLTEAEVMIAKGIAFDKLAVAKMVHPYSGLRNHLASMTVGGAFADLFERLQQPGISDPDAYLLLKDFLDALSFLQEELTVERSKLLYSAAAIKLLDRTGFAPSLHRCSLCQDTFGEEDVRQLTLDGTLTHEDCYRSVRSAQPNAEYVPHAVRNVVRFLREEPIVSALRVTGTTQLFSAASRLIAECIKQTPLTREPHGHRTIIEIVG